jgi:hypothetical protein
MNVDKIENVIATRRLSLLDSSGGEIMVVLGKPELSTDSIGYYCQFQITGIGSGQIKYAKGLDAIQAIQGAMILIGADLEFLNHGVANRLRWDGDEKGDLGFPTYDR